MTELHVIPGELLPPHVPPRRHLLSIADLSRGDVDRLLATAHSFALSQERDNKKLPTLRGRLILNVFYESSTRTSSSFELAAKRLSADTMTLKAAGSSVDKGESLKDTALTLAAYDPDVIVLRHPEVGAAEYVARLTPDRVREGQRVMHPGPMNRGVEIDARVADSDAALIVDQVRAGLIVRMAVLYDLLTTGPVAVETTMEVA